MKLSRCQSKDWLCRNGNLHREAKCFDASKLTVERAILWRSIILSALGKTVLPYCKHIKELDLDDLEKLLTDDRFRGNIAE